LSVLAMLPDGIAHEDLEKVMLSHSHRAAAALRQVGLAFDEAGRLRMLSPIREHVAEKHPPAAEALEPALVHYTKLVSQLGDMVGVAGGDDAVRRLGAEAHNIEEMLLIGLRKPDPKPAIRGALSHAEFQSFSGFGTYGILELARQAAAEVQDAQLEAECIRGLGHIAWARSQYDAAQERLEEARSLYRKVGSELGEANCIRWLGDIAWARHQQDAAGERYKEALPLYRKVGAVLDEANCIKGLGDIASARDQHDAARERYKEALLLYRKVGAVLGEANCIRGLGEIALERDQHDAAQERYQEALSLYRKVGSELGEANCITGLGDTALARSRPDTARERFEEALSMYERIKDPELIGRIHSSLARISESASDRKQHIAAARQAWQSIKRDDLVSELDVEFGK